MPMNNQSENCAGTHWWLVWADLAEKRAGVFDSLGQSEQTRGESLEFMTELVERVAAPRIPKWNHKANWNFELLNLKVRQKNGSDCGVWVAVKMIYLAQGLDLDVKHEHMNAIRWQLACMVAGSHHW